MAEPLPSWTHNTRRDDAMGLYFAIGAVTMVALFLGLAYLCWIWVPSAWAGAPDEYSDLSSARGEPDEQYEPTPHVIVEQMLDEIHVAPGDVVMDMGSGDGRIPIAAAKRGARAIGVEIQHTLIRQSKKSAHHAGVKVEWRRDNFFTTDLQGVTVVAFFMSPRIIARLWPRLQRDIPHARIVSYAYEGPVPPTRTIPAVFRDSVFWEPEGPDPVNLENRSVIYVWDHP